jgi:hypothetical protein
VEWRADAHFGARQQQSHAAAAAGNSSMAQIPQTMDQVALKWRDLAERRCSHFIELLESGRWKHYYDHEEFMAALSDAVRIAQRWAQIAPRSGDRQPPAEQSGSAEAA